MGIWVGVDWGSGAHAVCVIDAKGMVLDRFEVSHDRAGLAVLVTTRTASLARSARNAALYAGISA